MRLNTNDLTLQRNYLEKYGALIIEYESVKDGTHPTFRFAREFYAAHHTCAKSFLKYYNRHKQSGKKEDLLPRKRGPRYKTRRPLPFIEEKVEEMRRKGNNRYEIHSILKPVLKRFTPSPSGIYNICKRRGLNILSPPMQAEKRRIIKKRLGELGHIDCHYLSPSVLTGKHSKLFLVSIVDDYSRIAWTEVVEDITSLTVMFAVLKGINMLHDRYGITFAEVLTDNGPEFGQKWSKKSNAFERLLIQLGIKHRYTRPYRPQTNGKVERFWRTIEDDLLSGTTYDTLEDLREELLQYMYYYNELRPHQGIHATPPASMAILLPN